MILAILGVSMAVAIQIYARFAKTRAKLVISRTQAEPEVKGAAPETLAKLEALAERVRRLETGVSPEPIAEEQIQNIYNRLQDIEKALEPFKNRRLEITSPEYQFLMFEIDRLVKDLKADLTERQRIHERSLGNSIGTFRTIFVVSLTIVGIIIAGFGILIYFIGQQ